jgi:hypothetical protein
MNNSLLDLGPGDRPRTGDSPDLFSLGRRASVVKAFSANGLPSNPLTIFDLTTFEGIS